MSLQEEIELRITQHVETVLNKVPTEEKDIVSSEIINKVLDASWPDIKIMQQALLEMKHAQSAGPGWYTNGELGLKKQVRLWLDKGLEASESLNKLRGEK